MSSLSHQQARKYIQQSPLAEAEQLALRQHLAACAECKAYAATHMQLTQQLKMAGRARPTPAQRAAILDAANRRGAPRFWRPLAAAGGVAAVLFLATAVWLVLTAVAPMTSRPAVPAPLATLLAPFLPSAATLEAPEPAPALVPPPTATPPGTPDPRGRYNLDTVPAPSLAGNLIGEPLEQSVAVYLPPSYDENSRRRYPVVYALVTDYERYANQFERLNYLVRSGMNIAMLNGAREMIVVIPDVANNLNLINLLVNSPVTGDWERYIATDLVSYIDTHYRTIPAAGSRGLLGTEYHGLSAFTIAMRHSTTFSAVYLHQPDIYQPGGLDDSPMVAQLGREAILDRIDELSSLPAEEALARMQEVFVPGGSFVSAELYAFSYGLAYVPSAGSPAPFFDYPYADAGGPPDPDIWRRWESGFGDIPEKLEPYYDELMSLNLGLSSVDEPGTGATYLSEQLTAAGIPHDFKQAEGSWLEGLGQEAFPFFSEVLEFE